MGGGVLQTRGYEQHEYKNRSKLAAVRIANIDHTLEWFGNYTQQNETPIILIPERNSCLPYVYIPHGTYAVITKHGKFEQIRKTGGLHWCLPWTKIQFLITQQDITYKFPVRACPTYDNIFVALDICVVFRCKDDDDSIHNFCYRISINQLNEQLEAALTERIRVLIRQKTHLEVYQIKGKHNTQEMKTFLNEMFGQKGLEFLDIIITEVLLPEEIKQPLDLKAQFQSLNEMEKEKYNFDMRIINDNEELELLSQRRYEQRDSIKEDFSKQLTLAKRELLTIQAQAKKSVAEIKAQAQAEIATVQVEAELNNEKIRSDTQLVRTRDENTGVVDAKLLEVDAENTCKKKIAEKMLEVADLGAETTKIIGDSEVRIKTVMQSRRKYEYLMKQLQVVKALKRNTNVKIFGQNDSDSMTQMAAFRLAYKKDL